MPEKSKHKTTYLDLLSVLNAVVPQPADLVAKDIGCSVSELAPLVQEARINGYKIVQSPSGMVLSKPSFQRLLAEFNQTPGRGR